MISLDQYDQRAKLKASLLANQSGYPVAVLVGEAGVPNVDSADGHYIHRPGSLWSNNMRWCVCRQCGEVDFVHLGHDLLARCGCERGRELSVIAPFHPPPVEVIRAQRVAMGMRFGAYE